MSDDDKPKDPTLATVLRVLKQSTLGGLRFNLPGKITAYDAAKQAASVQLLIQEAHRSETGQRVAQTIAEIHMAPVMFQGNARGRITFPLAVGDTCVVMFSSASLTRWLQVGGIVDPADDRRHDISDAMVYPGGHDYKHVPTTAPTDATVIHGTVGSKVKVGGPSGTQRTFMADDFMSALDTLIAAIATAVGGITGSGSAAGTAITTAKTAFDVAAAAAKTTITEVK